MDPIFHWVPQSSILPESSQHEQQRQTPSSLDDWSKERPPTMSQTGSVGVGSSSATNNLDINDFTTLGDLGAATPALLASPQTFYSQLTQAHNQYFLPSYPTLAYGNSSWSSLPLSTYSTLNGATSSSNPATTQSQQQPPHPGQQQSPPPHSPTMQQHPTPQQQTQAQAPQQSHPIQSQPPESANSQPLMIDPSLTLSNGNPNLQPYGSHAIFASQPQRQQYPYTQTSLFIPSYYRQASTASPQGTLSPQALMNPSSLLTSINPASFYGNQSSATPGPQQSQSDPQAQSAMPQGQQQYTLQVQQQQPQPAELSPEEIAQRKARFFASIKPLLLSTAFTGAQAVNTLVERIMNNIQEADPSIRLEILTKIRDGAGNHYFRAWSENTRAMDITREWLKAAYTANDESPLIETIMPLLHIIDRLPLTLETLKASKLGKLVVKLVKDPPSPAIKDMASNIERRWRQLVSSADGTSSTPNNNSAEDSKSKKRKSSEPPNIKPLPPQKKQAIASIATTAPKPLVKDAKDKPKPAAAATAVKDAKSDSSFFSAPKPKPKLPSFKKAPVPAPVKKEENVAQPSSVDPFQEVLRTMMARKESPAVSTPPPTVNTPPQTNNLSKSGKKKKSVTWAPDAQLESVRLIERAVYDDDPEEGTHTAHSLRDLDRGEGAALHAQIFEETVDWSEPSLLEMPIDIDVPMRGERSQEKSTQEHREQTALSAVYMTPQMIPDSPAEPAVVIPEEEVDKDVVTMICGESDSIFWSGGMPIEPVSHMASVADLVGQLAAGSVDPALGGTHFNGQGLDLKSVGLDTSATLNAVSALPQEQLQQLLQQLASTRTIMDMDKIIMRTMSGNDGHLVEGAEGEGEDLGEDGVLDGEGRTAEAIDIRINENLAVSLQLENADSATNVTSLMRFSPNGKHLVTYLTEASSQIHHPLPPLPKTAMTPPRSADSRVGAADADADVDVDADAGADAEDADCAVITAYCVGGAVYVARAADAVWYVANVASYAAAAAAAVVVDWKRPNPVPIPVVFFSTSHSPIAVYSTWKTTTGH
ncbi:hypothetical protein P691DRAFT_776657 [Macrolepiota fuliginosa MF-IS2]|uniref:TFIIS N-terminal domain-containing protein n=1 Tax=Macrolepiota fuliginosa MF-IS2 TaxID=1400762 RepID=A0A9P5XB30_9AGAR|nr:hypothetical protein P691DRAFT_776657 [Macrolepiota fuliginosa MF-IS2]